jgi:hypothetical protein
MYIFFNLKRPTATHTERPKNQKDPGRRSRISLTQKITGWLVLNWR